MISSTHIDWRARLKAEWLLLLFAALASMLAIGDPQPVIKHRGWLQLPTLAGLLGLLIAIQGIRDSGVMQHAATTLAARMHSLRAPGLLLVASSALLATVLTNDVSLFLIVPLTVTLGGISNLPVLRMVIMEALAVNAGSTLSPIGNPQNLLLWQVAHVRFIDFVAAMLPAAVMMLVMLLVLTWCWLPSTRVDLDTCRIDEDATSATLATLSCIALAGMVLLMEYGHATSGALLMLLAFGVLRRRTLTRIDWWLLATFATIFLSLGHLAGLPLVQHALGQLDFSRPLILYASGIVASQLISNAPATVLLLEHTPDPLALAVAVNVGGFGLAIGSMAKLMALRLARQPHGLRQFHRISIQFLLVCASLVYLAWRWVAW